MKQATGKETFGERWCKRVEGSIDAYATDGRLARVERFGAFGVAASAILFGLGALKAILKGAGIISAEISDRLSEFMIPLTGALAGLVLLLLLAIFLVVGMSRARGANSGRE